MTEQRTLADYQRDMMVAKRAAVHAFVAAIAASDRAALAHAFGAVDDLCVWDAAWRLCARLPSVSTDMQDAFLDHWIADGDVMRGAQGSDDLVLIGALRVLLPPYSGPTMTLYRGDSAWNRRRRTYGMSWSASPQVADEFATNRPFPRSFQGGSVLLRAEAPPEAIICAPGVDNGEEEYLVDRRRLGRVEVLARYPQQELPDIAPN